MQIKGGLKKNQTTTEPNIQEIYVMMQGVLSVQDTIFKVYILLH
jgi:hypothetical protein